MTTMLSFWMILLISVTVECQECVPCPNMCSCQRRSTLDCSGLGLTSVVPGCGSGTIEEVNFSDNNITIIDWQAIPHLDGGFCEINLQDNRITKSFGTITAQECSFFDLDLSYNNLKTLSTDFVVVFGDISFVDIILTHNSITDIMPGAIKIHNSSSVFFDVDLSFNKVSYIHPGAFDLDIFTFDLILQNNNIVSFSILSAWRSSTHTPSSLDLDLSNNLIEDLEMEDEDNEYDNIYRRIDVNLDNNTWNCDCNHKSIAFDNSTLRGILKGSNCQQPTCGTPDVLRHVPILSLAPDDFVCPPSLDSLIIVTDIEISPGETANLICPVTHAEPPITHYDWTFSPRLSAAERKLFGAEPWEIQYTRRTKSNHIEVENVQLEGVYECRAVSRSGTLSVNISVSFPKIQTTLSSFRKMPSSQPLLELSSTEGSSDEATVAMPFSRECSDANSTAPILKVLTIVLCVVVVLLTVTVVAMTVTCVKLNKFLRSQKVIGRESDRVTAKGKQKSPKQLAIVKNEYKGHGNVIVDDEEYCVPSKGLDNKATDSDKAYENQFR